MLTILYAIASTLFSVIVVQSLICLRWVQRLPKTEGCKPLPKVSVVFAARDESERIETTVRRLLTQEQVDLEIIPVDDRSRDRTGAILKQLSTEDPRVHPKRVDVLPEDWLGKCYACHTGTLSASGDWLLFTDADCWLKPDVIAPALRVAQDADVQHITLTPGVFPVSLPAKAWHLAFLMTVADWIARTNADHPRGHLGVGAFNLVRRDIYQKLM